MASSTLPSSDLHNTALAAHRAAVERLIMGVCVCVCVCVCACVYVCPTSATVVLNQRF